METVADVDAFASAQDPGMVIAILSRETAKLQAEIDAIDYGQMTFDWRPGDVKVKLTRASSVPLALDIDEPSGVSS